MKKLFITISWVVLMFSCSNPQKAEEASEAMGEPTALAAMTVEELFAKQEGLAGKEVVLKGMVVHVCKHGGKRLHMISSEDGKQLKVEAGEEGKFEREMEGSDVLVTGTVVEERIDMAYVDQHEAEALKEHEGDEEQLQKVKENMAKMRKQIVESEKGYISKLSLECTGVEVKDM